MKMTAWGALALCVTGCGPMLSTMTPAAVTPRGSFRGAGGFGAEIATGPVLDAIDSVETLAELGLRLVDCGVLPYYLHQLDRVAGAAHFEVPESRGRELVQELRETLPGYAVPRYVSERAGERSKTVLL